LSNASKKEFILSVIQNLRIRNKLLLITGASLFVIIAIAITMLRPCHQPAEEKKLLVKNAVETAHGMVAYYHGCRVGAMCQEAARNAAMGALKPFAMAEQSISGSTT